MDETENGLCTALQKLAMSGDPRKKITREDLYNALLSEDLIERG